MVIWGPSSLSLDFKVRLYRTKTFHNKILKFLGRERFSLLKTPDNLENVTPNPAEKLFQVMGFCSLICFRDSGTTNEMQHMEFPAFPVGPARHLDVPGQKLPRDNFCLSIASQLPSPQG